MYIYLHIYICTYIYVYVYTVGIYLYEPLKSIILKWESFISIYILDIHNAVCICIYQSLKSQGKQKFW